MKNKTQEKAITQVHKLADINAFGVFILCDEDLMWKEDEFDTKFTDDEKEEIYERFHEGLSDVYDEILTNICNDIIENR